jgi:DNA-binding winged helix-turn-helix (wHTH) protein/tetratricopeptide (TPR) repeat protein
MGEARHDGLAVPGRVVLAHEQPFRIGPLAVDPPTRQVENGDLRETLEPRVMQVLVTLFRAGGAIVTRDDLIERCWEGRIVGEDSINRVLSRIRHIAAGIGGDAFAIETITKVGYRLLVAKADTRPLVLAPTPSAAPVLNRRVLVGGAGALAALAIGGAVLWPSFTGRTGPPPEAKSLFDRAVIIRQQDNRQALAYLREAVRIAPDYGQAWGALALSYAVAIENEPSERVAGFDERLREAVRNAHRYDPGNADAAAAMLPSLFFGKWLEVEPIYRTAIRRRSGDAAGYGLLGSMLMEVGRWSDAVAALRAAKLRNSSSPIGRYKLIVSLWAAGSISAAEDEIEEAMTLWPQHGAIWQTKIKLLALTGRPAQALALASDPAAMPLDEDGGPSQPGRLLFLTALATRASGDVEKAVEATRSKAREMEMARLNMALQATALGRVDLALDMLEGIYLRTGEWAIRSAATRWLATHPLFQPHARPLWREARFNRILDAVGLERYWRSSGVSPDYRRRG